MTAADVLNTYDLGSLSVLFRNYGEVENARRLAECVERARQVAPLVTSGDFYRAIESCIPKMKEKKYLAKVYQALRIEVNGELEVLKEMMEQAMEVLKPGGCVKQDLLYGQVEHNFESVNRKVIVPSPEEIERNPRARSAKLRIARKK